MTAPHDRGQEIDIRVDLHRHEDLLQLENIPLRMPYQDRYRDPQDGSLAHAPRDRGWEAAPTRDRDRRYDDYRRGRSPSPRSRTYRDRDQEGYRSSSYDSRSRSRSPPRHRSSDYGLPSREVILEGLPLDMVEEDISKELKQYHNVESLDDVRVIRERQTKVSRGFGFLRFPSLDHAKDFVERNYPMIYLYGPNAADGDDSAVKVRIAFSRERGVEKSESEWICKICTFSNFATRLRCHRCQTSKSDMAALRANAKTNSHSNNGASDASPDGAPSQFLLIRGLEPTVSEELLAKGVAKLYKPSRKASPSLTNITKKGSAKVASTTGDANLGAKEGSLRRVLLVRNRKTQESWRYGFAEFATVEDAQAAITRYNSFERFTISSKPVTADYVHAGIFVPVFNTTEDSEKFTFSPLSNKVSRLAYWDEEAYVSELAVSSGSPKLSSTAGDGNFPSASDLAAAAAEGEGLLEPGKESEAKIKKRKADASAAGKQKKTVPAHLQFWSNRHAELHGMKPDNSIETANDAKEPATKNGPSKNDSNPPTRTYADPTKNCCYLCSRQFKTATEVNKHERLSQLHRDNLQNADLVTKAEAKMSKAGTSTTPSNEDSSEYRDRAKERRSAFGTSKKISLPMKKSVSDPDTTEEKEPEAQAAMSKGASLLGKMGWSKGEGLGAQGTGRTETIATEMYVQGVGLGAQGGKVGDAIEEAGRNTKGSYGDFLERTRDKAKERFESMG